jgi:hypothetical protein
VGFENELISQSNFPRQLSPRIPSRVANFFLSGRFSKTPRKIRPGPPPPAGICRQRHALRKVECWAKPRASIGPNSPLVELLAGAIEWFGGCLGRPGRALGKSPFGKQPLRVFRCSFTFSSKIRA